MCAKQQMPVVVMLENGNVNDAQAVRDWMENSRFATTEAEDIFAALEQMEDFTTDYRPDVILLDVESCKADLPIIRGTMEAVHESDIPLMAISNLSEASLERGAFEGNFEAVVAHLDELIPVTAA